MQFLNIYEIIKRDFNIILILFTITLSMTTFYFAGYDTGHPAITGTYFSSENTESPLSYHWSDIGSGKCMPVNLSNYWKFNSYWADEAYYLLQAQGKQSIPPYSYRIVTPALAGLSHELFLTYLSGIPVINFPDSVLSGFAFINFLFIFFSSYLLYLFLKDIGFNSKYGLIGSILFLSSLSVIEVGTLPMVDAGTYFFMIAGLYSIWKNYDLLYVVSTSAGILNKETIAILIPIFLINKIRLSDNVFSNYNLRKTVTGLLPVIAFVFPRYYFDKAIVVNYGYNVLNNEFPTSYIIQHLSYPGIIAEIFGIFSSFLFLWIGLRNVRSNNFIFRSTVVALPLIIAAQVFLASRTTRIIFQIYPLIIASFLYYLQESLEKEEPEENI